MVHSKRVAALRYDTTLIVIQRRGRVDPAADWPAVVDFIHHPSLATCLPRGVDRRVRVVRQADAFLTKSTTGTAGVQGLQVQSVPVALQKPSVDSLEQAM